MKFPRNARILHSQLDAAPFASVFFLLIIFVLLGSLVYTPGVRIQLPEADGLPGTGGPRISMAVDASGQYYFENQLIRESELQQRLKALAAQSPEKIKLVVQADKEVKEEVLMRLVTLASRAGMEPWLAALPRAFDKSSDRSPAP